MKKRRNKVLLIVLALVVVLAAALAYLSPMLAMDPAPTGLVGETGILALHSGANSLYFLPAQDGLILVDAGASGDKVAQGLPEIGVDPGEVRYILLTHSDSDHVAALELFPDARIYMAADEVQMIDGTTKRNPISRNALPQGVDVEEIVLLEHGQQIGLGGRQVTCLAAPGHTPGSMAYLVDGDYLFTGDAVRIQGGKLSVHPFTMDSGLAKDSIHRLAGEQAELVLTAHYGWFAADELE